MTRHLLAALGLLAVGTAQAELIAIKDAEVRTFSRLGTLSSGTVLIRDGRIEAVGLNVPIPANATLVDGRGKILTPGLFAAETELGIKEIDGVDETNDVASEQPRYSAALDVTDALNPDSAVIPVTRVDGVTRAVSTPGSKKGGSLIAGQSAVISLAGRLAGDDEHFVTRPRVAMVAALGEFGADISGGSRPAAFARLREAFEEAKAGGLRSGPGLVHESQLSPLDIAALKPVLAGEQPLVLHVDRASDIRAALRLADDYGIKLIISGGVEAWRVAKQLAEQRVPVLLDPSENLPARFETLHVREDAPQRLLKAGVRFAFIGGGQGGPRNLRQVAGIAAAWDLPKDIALAAITLYPAEIFGLADSLGGIAPGMRADLVLWDGDPLELRTAASQVWIDGQAMPMQNRQTLLRDKYLKRLNAPAPSATPATTP